MSVVRSAHRVDVSRFRRTDDAVTDETTSRFFSDLLLPKKLTEGLTNAGDKLSFYLNFYKSISLLFFSFICLQKNVLVSPDTFLVLMKVLRSVSNYIFNVLNDKQRYAK
jgi:hypothetical protein